MYFLTCFSIAASSGLIFKTCLFHVQHRRWPCHPQELLSWRMRMASKIILSLWVGLWLLGGLTKPMAALSSTGIALLLLAMSPLLIFLVLYLKNHRQK